MRSKGLCFLAIGSDVRSSRQNVEMTMATTENYVYQFESALDQAKEVHTATGLLASLDLNLPSHDNRWKNLEGLVIQKQNEGYDFNRGRATLAVFSQETLNPLVEQFKVYSFGLCHNEDEPWKKDFVLELGAKGSRQIYSELVQKEAEIAFPHVLKRGLQKLGLLDALNGVRVEDGECTQVDKNASSYQSLLYFRDHYRDIGWWSVGVGEAPIVAIYKASVSGYQFALDSRRSLVPINQHSAAWHEIEEHKRHNPREYRRCGICFDLIL